MLPIIERLLQEAENLKRAGEEIARGLSSLSADDTDGHVQLAQRLRMDTIGDASYLSSGAGVGGSMEWSLPSSGPMPRQPPP